MATVASLVEVPQRLPHPAPAPAQQQSRRRHRRAGFTCARTSVRPWTAPVQEPLLGVTVCDAAGSEALLRACAALRVECFYSYTDDNALAILFGPQAETAELAWAEARLRVEAARSARMQSLGMQVTCLAAVCCATHAGAVHGGSPGGSDHVRGRLRAIRLVECDSEVVGTLDIHVGDRLPGEPLEGSLPGKELPQQAASGHTHPWWLPYATAMTRSGVTTSLSARSAYGAAPWAAAPGGDRGKDTPTVSLPPFVMPPADAPEPFDAPAVAAAAAAAAVRPSGCHASGGARAYIFNVCVSPSARRRGVAAALLSSAHDMAAAAGVEVLYVHVEEDNSSARRLYQSCGYAQESMEPEWLALRMGRPRRLLLRKWLAPVTHQTQHSGDN